SYVCRRIELNALTAPALVAYLERQLQAAGFCTKVIPSEDELRDSAQALCRMEAGLWVKAAIERLLGIDWLKNQVADAFLAGIPLGESRSWVEAAFAKNVFTSWQGAISERLCALLQDRKADLARSLVYKIDVNPLCHRGLTAFFCSPLLPRVFQGQMVI